MKKIQLGGNIKGAKIRGYALVDDEDFYIVSKFSWCLVGVGYAMSFKCKTKERKAEQIGMHRLVMNAPIGMVVDHINHNKLDNRKKNLRICSIKENVRNHTKLRINNTSGFHGVYFDKSCNKWLARIWVDNIPKNLGFFSNILDAAKARDKAAKKYHGKFASLNINK